MILSVDDLHFSYGETPILKNISLSVKNQEMVMILGPNGSGKTTLLRCLNGINRPQKGTITLEDKNMRRMSGREIARRIGYVPQSSEKVRLTAFDAILLGRRPYVGWRLAESDIMKVDAIIHTLGLDELALRYLDEMSGGELQKVTIARALVQEPRILLLDEPISSLDVKNQIEIMETMKHIIKGHGLSAVISLHDLTMALRYGDRFVFMKKGEIRYVLAKDEISPQVIADIYDISVDIEFVHGSPVIIPAW
ncbi:MULTISPECIES: ABC transporter ATP-binding protein [Aminobacterium]|jgi:iron complex transport system ATP-binding protein|uniref:ABC transporter ATP-binding protein n=1 Tax=Aminobacterium TaxID=81466 RepID=UPI0016B3C308|nr:ABC transporter ATP-binding protein [Aminobacterium sp. EBM-42]MDD2378948.1 ABC transporter ATP-binding protein [Aminobacterium colombiense]MDD3767481.1 ABC transporter ATP-binding protein [Aminobacterium colombiense]MDD4265607.1 ABC transporter ATP-binding protein [Aminobacterium colombiense]MDD4586577.1 ABC transporter ATP-binding protein [Aminobacterium colombiense]NLK30237.1 ABC transporter ATP-binding protein [Aminobacterium colombiense]